MARRIAVLVLALLAAAPAAGAQERGTAVSRLPLGDTLPGLWREGGNAAGLGDAGLRGGGRIRFGAAAEGGSLRRPQSPGGVRGAGFAAEADRTAGGWTLLGAFRYGRRADRDVAWSAVSDPYAGSPYLWADSAGGDWRRDDVAVRAAVGSPRRGRVVGGVALEYEVGEGARQNDPAPLFRRRDITLTPGLAFRIAPGHTLGATVMARWAREEQEIGFGSADDPFVYHLRGLGTFDRTQLLSASRASVGRRLGAGAQYQGVVAGWRTGAAVEFRAGADSVRDGVAAPAFGGRFDLREGEARLSARRSRTQVELGGGWSDGRGTDPVFLAVNTTDRAWRVDAGVRAWGGGSPEAAPSWLSFAAKADRLERRDVVALTSWEVVAFHADAAAGARWRRPRAGTLLGELRAGASRPLRSTYASGSTSPLVPALVRPDYDYHAAPLVRGGLSLAAERSVGGAGTRARLRLDADAALARAHEGGERGRLSFSLEILR